MLRPTLFGLTALAAALVSSAPPAPGRAAPAPAPAVKGKELVPAPTLEARFTDGSVLNLKVLDDKITLETAYGRLVIPVADIYEIEFATRIPDDAARQINAAAVDLGSSTQEKRDAASTKLEKFHRLAYAALSKAEGHNDPEVRKRVRKLLDMIRRTVPENLLKVVPHDVIQTKDSRIAGRIAESAFKGETFQFGEGPPTLTAYQGQIGQTFVFSVTGALNAGAVWGTDFYTLDSALATAAVHAGVLRPGMTGNVTVRLHGPRNGFTGSMRNGVASHPFAQFPGAYEIVKK